MKNFNVFCITAFFSLFAHIWLVIVLVVSSPNKVDVWEAVLTLLFFPLLVCIAYAGDKGLLHKMVGLKKSEAPDVPEQLALGESKILLPVTISHRYNLNPLQLSQCWRMTS